ncbi:hypothetical protein M3638_03025 [Oceanobacillus profundus]|uniref:hypothetical protein n=1 Tax=Oceanobacillus profundus TaxID=372463 RepID=UPI00203FF421|nr:hypothetical protein [Oceanobacillus profundus]MCM3396812.1 hypothetical protein [Oceanobacillus profundus]
MSKEKRVILTIDNVRIKDYDSMNVTVERYEDVFIPKDKQTIKKWVFKGYSRSILSALLMIQRKELLIDRNEIRDLNGFIKHVEQSNVRLMEVMKE